MPLFQCLEHDVGSIFGRWHTHLAEYSLLGVYHQRAQTRDFSGSRSSIWVRVSLPWANRTPAPHNSKACTTHGFSVASSLLPLKRIMIQLARPRWPEPFVACVSKQIRSPFPLFSGSERLAWLPRLFERGYCHCPRFDRPPGPPRTEVQAVPPTALRALPADAL